MCAIFLKLDDELVEMVDAKITRIEQHGSRQKALEAAGLSE